MTYNSDSQWHQKAMQDAAVAMAKPAQSITEKLPAADSKSFAITQLEKTATGSEERILTQDIDFKTAHRTAVKYGFGVMYKAEDGVYYRLSASERSALRIEVYGDTSFPVTVVHYE